MKHRTLTIQLLGRSSKTRQFFPIIFDQNVNQNTSMKKNVRTISMLIENRFLKIILS